MECRCRMAAHRSRSSILRHYPSKRSQPSWRIFERSMAWPRGRWSSLSSLTREPMRRVRPSRAKLTLNLDGSRWQKKKRREHIVPLSSDAVRLLEGLYRDQSDWVFFGAKPVKLLSHDAMRKVLGRLRPGLTVHGFRSCFRDWAGDQTPFASEVIDFALAHSISDTASAAYRR